MKHGWTSATAWATLAIGATAVSLAAVGTVRDAVTDNPVRVLTTDAADRALAQAGSPSAATALKRSPDQDLPDDVRPRPDPRAPSQAGETGSVAESDPGRVAIQIRPPRSAAVGEGQTQQDPGDADSVLALGSISDSGLLGALGVQPGTTSDAQRRQEVAVRALTRSWQSRTVEPGNRLPKARAPRRAPEAKVAQREAKNRPRGEQAEKRDPAPRGTSPKRSAKSKAAKEPKAKRVGTWRSGAQLTGTLEDGPRTLGSTAKATEDPSGTRQQGAKPKGRVTIKVKARGQAKSKSSDSGTSRTESRGAGKAVVKTESRGAGKAVVKAKSRGVGAARIASGSSIKVKSRGSVGIEVKGPPRGSGQVVPPKPSNQGKGKGGPKR